MTSARVIRPRVLGLFSVVVLSSAACDRETTAPSAPVAAEAQQDTAKRSSFGVYEGYDPVLYNEFVRQSVHVPMRDGVRLAVEIYRPAEDGEAVETPWPVLFTYSVYPRISKNEDGSIGSWIGPIDLSKNAGSLVAAPDESIYGKITKDLVRRGYVVAVATARGSGASFGINSGEMSAAQMRDGYDLVEWFADQPFSTGKVGMFGPSYHGQIQMATAAEAPLAGVRDGCRRAVGLADSCVDPLCDSFHLVWDADAGWAQSI